MIGKKMQEAKIELDKIYNKSCEDMSEIPDDSVGLIVTSPPYFSLREYATWDTYPEYMQFIRKVLKECFRVLIPGRWICWNVQEGIAFPPKQTGKERYCQPLSANTITAMLSSQLMLSSQFLYEKTIIWYKGKGTATQKLFGTFPLPGLILCSGRTEHIITARKPRGDFKENISKEIKERSKITKKEWADWAVDLWQFPPTKKSVSGHPAAFPLELPRRCIRLWSFYGDVVLDPFLGGGSSAIAAKREDRHYIGYEIHKEFIDETRNRMIRGVGINFND